MAILPSAAQLWQNRKQRNVVLLVVLLGVLALVVAARLLGQKPVPDGALNRVVCSKCGLQADMMVVDIDEPKYICPKCQGKLVHLWKCEDCHFEYPQPPGVLPKDIPEKTMAKFRLIMEMHKCPNCKSLSTIQVPAADQPQP
jgi:rubredoxin